MVSLEELYKDNGFPGINRLFDIAKHEGLNVNRKQVEAFVASHKVTQLHRKPTKAPSNPISAPGVGFSYQMDLLDLSPLSRSNSGTNWLLIMVDIFTRRLAVSPLSNKKASTALIGIKDCIGQLGGVPPLMMQSDQGSEWKDQVAKFLKNENIVMKQSEVGDHRSLGIIDSASRLVKNWVHKHITYHQSERYLDDLPAFVKTYNNTTHRSLFGLTPNQAVKFPSELRRLRFSELMEKQQKKPSSAKLKIGDYVRTLKLKKAFQKGYHVKWSLTVYKIVEIRGLNYILDNGKQYRIDMLQKVPEPVEEVKDVAKKARFDHRTKVILKSDGVDPANLRRSVRERKPRHQLEDEEYGNVIYS